MSWNFNYRTIHFSWPWHIKLASYTFLNLHFSCINHFSFEALFYSCSDLFLLAAYSAQWTSIPKRVGALNNCSLFSSFWGQDSFLIRIIHWLWKILSFWVKSCCFLIILIPVLHHPKPSNPCNLSIFSWFSETR